MRPIRPHARRGGIRQHQRGHRRAEKRRQTSDRNRTAACWGDRESNTDARGADRADTESDRADTGSDGESGDGAGARSRGHAARSRCNCRDATGKAVTVAGCFANRNDSGRRATERG